MKNRTARTRGTCRTSSGAAGAASAPNVLDGDGAAIVVHARLDDYRTDPAGDSGDRIACGVIEPR